MRKLSLALLALTAMSWGQANAIPVTWTLSSGASPAGSFVFDADGAGYSAVNLTANFALGGTQNISLLGSGNNASNLNTFNLLGYFLNIDFLSPLTNAGGSVNFSSQQGWAGFVTANDRGTVGGTPSSVPEPGSLFLLGAGLVGLGLVRRRKVVA